MYVQSANVFCLRTLEMADNSLVKTELVLVKGEPMNEPSMKTFGNSHLNKIHFL